MICKILKIFFFSELELLKLDSNRDMNLKVPYRERPGDRHYS